MATKKASGKNTPKDFFLYLLMIVALYASIISLDTLLWQIINLYIPDPADYFYYSGVMRLMRGAMATIFVVWPVFLGVSFVIEKDLRKNTVKKDFWVRRWLLYLTLFIAAITMIVDSVNLLNGFLGGDLTTRFLLKGLVILLTAVTVFAFYVWELQRDPVRKTMISIATGIFASVVVIAALVGGFVSIGSPSYQRDVRLDEQRVSDLQSLQSYITNYWSNNESLPGSLGELDDEFGSTISLQDPETNVPYEYRKTGETTYELCADFARPFVDENRRYSVPVKGIVNDWSHGTGNSCFNLEIDQTIIDSMKDASTR